jgi:GMP synthase (glutamine-hydrolysing)
LTEVQQKVLIVDYGSQYTQLIARRIRQLHIFCEIVPHTEVLANIEQGMPAAVILSGGPRSVNDLDAPLLEPKLLALPVPILGICYGLQLLAHLLGGKVVTAAHREYGRAQVCYAGSENPAVRKLFKSFSVGEPFEVWMSHGDSIEALPKDFEAIATTASTPCAAIAHRSRPIFGLQFHPEVSHSPRGLELLQAFLLNVAAIKPTWTMSTFLQQQVEEIQFKVGAQQQVVCGLSGGVDSAVVAALLARALGSRLHCIFVDNGLVRRGETDQVRQVFAESMGVPLHVVDAREAFVTALRGVLDPEKKRKIIGKLFIDVFEAEARKIPNAHFLAQGTLYPDVIESVSFAGAVTIKSHHNVGGLPERMHLKLIEPLRALFKDEVRELGEQLGLPHQLCYRHPFPGPGLAVRIVGEVNAAQLDIVRHADVIVEEEIRAAQLYETLWQSFAVLLPVRSVGVMGDARTFEQTLAVRCVQSTDGMTADWARLPHEVLARISNRIINEVRGVNRVVYDISSKPPATIEWE